MTFLQTYSTPVITFAVLVSNIAFVLFVLGLLSPTYRPKILFWVRKYTLELLFLFSVSSVVGSLIYSEIMGFPPCDLCWIIRIFLYPTAIISAIGIWKKDYNSAMYILALSLCALVISLYFSFVQWGFGSSLLACTSEGGACAKVYVNSFGYITIPFMALSTSVYLTALSIIALKKNV